MSKEKKVYLHTGSNLGNRAENLQKANQLIEQQIGRIVKASHLYETQAWGITEQPDFLNQALLVHSSLSPQEVLKQIYHIEQVVFQRVRHQKWAERIIDIDILLYDNQVIHTNDLVIPHPQIQHRNFVLVPLMEIAGDLLHPVLQETIEELYWTCEDKGEVIMTED